MAESIIEKIFGRKESQLTTEYVRAKIPALKRMVEDYERQAVAAEAAALENSAKAFSPDTPSAERARLMRQSSMDAKKASFLAGFAKTFLSNLGYATSLYTTMQITDEMKEVGLLSPDATSMDWQKAMGSMQDDIQQMIDTTQRLGDVLNSALSQEMSTSELETADELDQLFAKWDAEKDPVKKAELQKRIRAKSGAAIA